jgi:signal transduction histidine kinase
MQQTIETVEWSGTECKRVEAVVETLANLRSEGESLAEVAHDARNMVTALGLYCDLLEEPGVLATPFLHYGSELRLVATASRRLVEKLVALDRRLDTRQTPLGANDFATAHAAAGATSRVTEIDEARVGGRFTAQRWIGEQAERPERWDLMPAEPIRNLASELLANRNLLAALAGPAVALTVEATGCSKPVKLNGEDLTRILVNLVKNAAEAMPSGGLIKLSLREHTAGSGSAWVALTVEDSGPGIPAESLDRVFESGYTMKSKGAAETRGWPATHRGLGLAITRSIVEEAGGRIRAANRVPSGARIEIELPVRGR